MSETHDTNGLTGENREALLARLVEERTRELRDSMRQLEEVNMRLQEANQHKNRFLSAMSHELRTPLNAVLGFNDLLKGQFFGPLNEKQLSYLDQIESSAKHLLALISDLLDIAKIDSGAMQLDIEDLPVEELIYAALTMMNPQFKEKNLNVNAFVDPELTTIQADRRKTKQILLNLLSNAYKYTPVGGRIDVRATFHDPRTIRISVGDTGVGIKQEDLDKVFGDLYQADRPRDQKLGGSGIGLALTRRMVALHGGQIFVTSELGKGSEFWFLLPIRQGDGARAEPPPPEEPTAEAGPAPATNAPPGPRSRILVVDDEPTNLNMVLDMLSIQGHEARGADNGRAALNIADEFKPDLILMDIRMPGMTGIEAVRELRTREAFRSTPIIALTANTYADSRRECLEAGCTDYVAKPMRVGTLFKMIESYLTPPAQERG